MSTPQFIAPDLSRIPPELRALPRWVTWRAEGKPGEAPRKVPHDAKALSACASTTDPATWASFAEAEAAYLEREGQPDAFTGVGIVLDGDGLAGVDIDHCVTDGKPDPVALALLDSLGAAYVEVSPSGTGLRAFGYAERLERGAKGKANGLDVELYTTGRYLTLTGQTIKAGPISPLRGFGELAERIRADRKVNPETGEVSMVPPDQHHAELVRRVLSGENFHESLRDLAASLAGTGMQPGAVVNHLRGLMDASAAKRDDRWAARRAQIPDLVNSASAKFSPVVDFSALLAQSQAANEPRYRLLGWPELETLPPIRWRVRGILPSTGVAAIYGPSKSGKSFLSFDLACAIAEGRDWFGYRTTPADVVLVCLEGEAGYKLRAQAWMQHHGRPLPERLRLVLQPWKVTAPQDVADLAAVVPAGAVVFVDTMNRASPNADENSSKDMGQIIEGTKALQSLTGGLAVLVAHTGKDATKGLRGHSSLIAALDGAIEVAREGNRRTWTADKVKDGADGAVHPFALETLELGHDEDGEPLTSCAVSVGSDEQAGNWPKPLTERQREGMATFYRAVLEHGQESDDGQLISVHLEQWRPEFYKTCTADDQEAKKKAFQRVRGDLVQLGRLSLEHDNYRCPMGDTGLNAARLLASFAPAGTRDRDGTEPGHVPHSHPT